MTNKITYKDFNQIMDGARRFMGSQSAPVHLSNQVVNGRGIGDLCLEAHLAVIESTIQFLFKKGLLKEIVSIDYKQNTVESVDD